MGNFAYVVWAKEPMLPKIAGLSFVRWLGHLPCRDRIAAQVLGEDHGPKIPRRRERPGVFTVEIFASEDAGSIARAARGLGFQVISQEPKAHLLLVKSTESESGTQKADPGVVQGAWRTLHSPANRAANGQQHCHHRNGKRLYGRGRQRPATGR